jgi:8-hydroxy-5-deazaflavin:NADPH oxidoreductase
MKSIAILGTGGVGQTLASKFLDLGHKIMLGTRNVENKLSETTKDQYGNLPFKEWFATNKGVKLGTLKEAAAFGEIILNATKGSESINALKAVEQKDLEGKILIDIANPLDFSMGMPPRLIPELCNTNSLAEEIQRTFPKTRVVKTLNTMWSGLMINPGLVNKGDHDIFVCGNDPEAKEEVKKILKSFGWSGENILDLGDISAARATEMYLPLWLRISAATNFKPMNLRIVN